MGAKKTVKKPAKKSGPKRAPIDSSAEFEKLLRQAANGQRFVLRLYVTGSTVRSSHAVANVRSLCEEYLPGRYDLEVVDIYQQPSEAAKDQVIAAPTLIKELPTPVKRLIGDLSDRDKVIVGLNLAGGGDRPKSTETHWAKL
ncbi:KaiB domain protein [Chthoniobacter flavus Ellin428]|uniref:KaiB domain protein n=1 Tax=Chthoniobacter flavus Ellin428 TaxID=497964 RepID=B4DAC6_9BACT|nr:circadian clock KaiB family protein [Chthoniobacter flavus]EDY16587.1 KaiB domain protein [Chthoniobacter flavus Ellin428]TCO91991.1 circadian clock protein KaiB [Chthoniobacter flavus]